jgi:hypothetical protein
MLKIAVVSAVLTALPVFAIAAGCSSSHQAATCAEGEIYDMLSGKCVVKSTS